MKRAAAESEIVVAGAGAPADEDLRIPLAASGLKGFRAWSHSPRFPEAGRIDYLAGDVEIDMSPEDLHTHGTLKAALAAELFSRVAKRQRGYVFVDRTRVTEPAVGLSVEPDLVVVLFSSLDDGRVRQVPSIGHAAQGPGRFREIEGAPDLVVEIVSDNSVRKDTERLPALYARAGVPELWLVDARGAEPRLEVLVLAGGEYRRQTANPAGWTHSPFLATHGRITRQPAPHSGWLYELELAAPT